MLDEKNLLQLMKVAARANSATPVAYSYNGKEYSNETVNEALREELKQYSVNARTWDQNAPMIYALIAETVDDVLPKRAADAYAPFAEVKQYRQGEKPIFYRKRSARQRAKQFITRVGLAGRYEVFKLGGDETFEVKTSAIGGAAQIGYEEFLDGRVDFAEVLQIVIEGMDELIYQEVAKAMQAAINELPTNNQVSANDFDEAEFDRLITITSAYGNPVIYCSNEFAVRMIPRETWRYSEDMKNELHRTGKLNGYKGHPVVILPQGIVDETNSQKTIDPSYCWIMPSTGEKPVKIAFEGDTQMKEFENRDWSKEIQVYKKVGVVALLSNDICVYRDTSLANLSLASTLTDEDRVPTAIESVKQTVVVDGIVQTKEAESENP